MADSDDQLPEANENNNSDEGTISSFALPDLVVYTVTSDPQYPAAGDSVTWTVTVKNSGSGSSGPFNVAFDDDDQPSLLPTETESVTSLAAGSTKELTFTHTAVAGDQYWFLVDSDEEVSETNENNNSHAVELSPADLEITGVSYSPESPSVGDDVTWTVIVKNNGPGNATAFNVAFDDDGPTGPATH